MKRTTLTVAILVMSLLSIASNRRPMAHFENSQTRLAAGADISHDTAEPQGDMLTEEFHQRYPLNPTGRVSIANINGDVRIAVWDQSEVKVDAVKKTIERDRLDEQNIKILNEPAIVRIKTKSSDMDLNERD